MNGKSQKYIPLLASAGVGALLFLFRFGGRILDPRHVEWLLARDDTAAHYIGWLFFRSEGWSFPLGKITSYLWPAGTSVALTGSLPLLALPFKALDFLLPEPFQFSGWWMLLSYCLHGLFAYLLARELTGRRLLQVLAVLLLLLSPAFLNREGHIALSSHWVLLAALWLYLRRFTAQQAVRIYAAWLLLLLVCCGLHPFMPLMVSAIALAAWVRDFAIDRTVTWRVFGAVLLLAPALMLLSAVVQGYFLSTETTVFTGTEYANSAMNLNAAWNPLDTSRLLPELPTVAAYKEEGYNYFGLGVIALLAAALAVLLRNRPAPAAVRRHVPLIVVLAGLTLLAVGNRIAFGDQIVLSYAIPGWLLPLLSPFRACGRLFWPVFYVLVAFAIGMLAGRADRRPLVVFFGICVLLQALDVSPLLDLKPEYRALRFESRMRSPLWDRIMTRCDRILTYPPYLKDTDYPNDFRDIALLANRYGKPTSAGYVARQTQTQIAGAVDDIKEQLFAGAGDPGAITILRSSYFAEKFVDIRRNMTCTEIDGFKVCFAKSSPIRVPAVYELDVVPFAVYLERIRNGFAVITVKEEATRYLTEAAKAVLRGMGSQIDRLRYGGSYLAIVYGGQLLFEQVQNENVIVLQADRGEQAGPVTLRKSLLARSGGLECGDVSSLLVDGQEKIFNHRGFNVAVLDERQNVIEVASFDTHVRSEGYVFRLVATR